MAEGPNIVISNDVTSFIPRWITRYNDESTSTVMKRTLLRTSVDLMMILSTTFSNPISITSSLKPVLLTPVKSNEITPPPSFAFH
jgi:hypothetical protein